MLDFRLCGNDEASADVCKRSNESLAFGQLASGFQIINFFHRFVIANPHNTQEAQGVTAFVARRNLHVIESDFNHDFRFNCAHFSISEFLNGGRSKPNRKLSDFKISQARIRLADVEQSTRSFAFANSESKVREYSECTVRCPLQPKLQPHPKWL